MPPPGTGACRRISAASPPDQPYMVVMTQITILDWT
jgi:hypothetical protein